MVNAFMETLCYWSELAEEERKAVEALGGHRLFFTRGGEVADLALPEGDVLILLSCWAARFQERPNGRRVIFELLLPGDLADVEADLVGTEIVGGAILSSGYALLVKRHQLEELVKYEAIARAMRAAKIGRQAIRREWLVNVGSRKVEPRLAHLLCELSLRARRAGCGAGAVSEMPLTQTDLSEALCVSDAHLNVALQRLRKLGLVELAQKQLTIRNWPQLADLAEFDDAYLRRSAPLRRRKAVGAWSSSPQDLDLFS